MKKMIILLIGIFCAGISGFSQNTDNKIYRITRHENLGNPVPGNDTFGLFIDNNAMGSATFLTFNSLERATRDPYNNYVRSMLFDNFDPDENQYNRFILNGNTMEYCVGKIVVEENNLCSQIFLLGIPMLILEATAVD
jgi:hypothetical protein